MFFLFLMIIIFYFFKADGYFEALRQTGRNEEREGVVRLLMRVSLKLKRAIHAITV